MTPNGEPRSTGPPIPPRHCHPGSCAFGDGMTTRPEIRALVAPHLPIGETFEAAFQATSGPHPKFAFRYRVVAVTNRRIHLFTAALWRVCQPKRLITTLPPGTVLASRASHLIYEEVLLAGERLWVNLAWQDELSDAVLIAGRHGRR